MARVCVQCAVVLFFPSTKRGSTKRGSTKRGSTECESTECESTECESTECESTKCVSIKCVSTKCVSTKRESTKCVSTKRESTKCVSTKCESTKQQIHYKETLQPVWSIHRIRCRSSPICSSKCIFSSSKHILGKHSVSQLLFCKDCSSMCPLVSPEVC